jgi:tagatose-1,6-bisphosphate aldolase
MRRSNKMANTYYFEIEGITHETLQKFIQICKEEDLFYIVNGLVYNDAEHEPTHYEEQ